MELTWVVCGLRKAVGARGKLSEWKKSESCQKKKKTATMEEECWSGERGKPTSVGLGIHFISLFIVSASEVISYLRIITALRCSACLDCPDLKGKPIRKCGMDSSRCS